MARFQNQRCVAGEPLPCGSKVHCSARRQIRAHKNDRHWYAYDVAFDGEIIVADNRDPAHDLARALLARSIKGNVTVHDGPTRKPRIVVNIEKAAPWCVGSNLERYKWKAPDEDGYLVLPTMPNDDKAVA